MSSTVNEALTHLFMGVLTPLVHEACTRADAWQMPLAARQVLFNGRMRNGLLHAIKEILNSSFSCLNQDLQDLRIDKIST